MYYNLNSSSTDYFLTQHTLNNIAYSRKNVLCPVNSKDGNCNLTVLLALTHFDFSFSFKKRRATKNIGVDPNLSAVARSVLPIGKFKVHFGFATFEVSILDDHLYRLVTPTAILYVGCGDVITSTTVAVTPCCRDRKHCHYVRFYITSHSTAYASGLFSVVPSSAENRHCING